MLLTVALSTFALVGVVVAIQAYGFDWTRPDSDPWNYLAAGERLNAGHRLYALSDGDRVVSLRPPYWSVPLLAPPPIAVAWRALAWVGEPAMVLWGIACLAAATASVVFLLRAGRLAGLALLAMPLTSRWRAVAVTVVVSVVILVIALLGSGVSSFADWFGSAPGSAPSPLAVSTLTGLPPLVVVVLLCLPILVSGRSDVWGFRLAAVAAALATPALYVQALAVLGAARAPRGRAR